jgi:HD-GYP domain-containing protein (c-di-GMP phosphodiesterase class II)
MLSTTRVDSAELEIGMYVSALDRPWLETPFLMQGFLLQSREDIERVREYCKYVYVDKIRSQNRSLLSRLVMRADPAAAKRQVRERPRIALEKIFPGRKLKAYPEVTTWQEEEKEAEVALDSLVGDVVDVFDHVRDGGNIDLARVKGAVSPIVESMSRNPDACMWLARMKQHDQYSYQHALSSSIWSVALGRQLGLGRPDLRALAMGGMLMDIGKLRVNQELLKADRDLNDEEEIELRAHVASGVSLLAEKGMVNQDVMDMVACHHERYDGTGYPRGLKGEMIPAAARIAAIVDTYDALTSLRAYAKPVSPAEAIRIIYHARDEEFQAELVEAFIQAVGVYPAGTLVELSSGEIGVVAAESRVRRMLPTVVLLMDAQKNRLAETRMIDLMKEAELTEGHGPKIRKSLEPGAYGIDVSAIERPRMRPRA